MNDHLILQNINKHISLSDTEKELFLSSIKSKTYSKKEIIIRQGDRCNHLYFVEVGSLRAYNINEEGRESTIMFAIQDWWITDMNAFTNKLPALLSIQAIQDSQLTIIEQNVLERLFKEIPKLERFFRIIFQKAYIREQLRVLDSISLTTEQRYSRFTKKYPNIVEKITQKQIASYLGVTPEFLSAVKKK